MTPRIEHASLYMRTTSRRIVPRSKIGSDHGTVTDDVPAGTLAVARGRQRVIEGWTRPVKAKKS